MRHQQADVGALSDEDESRFGDLLPYDVVAVQRISQNSVIIAFDLLILKNYIIRMDEAHVGWVKADIACHEKNVLELVHLAVGTNIGTNDGVHALNVQVLLNCGQLEVVVLVVDDEIGDDLVARNLNTNSHWRLLTKVLAVIGIQSFEFAQIRNE